MVPLFYRTILFTLLLSPAHTTLPLTLQRGGNLPLDQSITVVFGYRPEHDTDKNRPYELKRNVRTSENLKTLAKSPSGNPLKWISFEVEGKKAFLDLDPLGYSPEELVSDVITFTLDKKGGAPVIMDSPIRALPGSFGKIGQSRAPALEDESDNVDMLKGDIKRLKEKNSNLENQVRRLENELAACQTNVLSR